MSFFGSSPVAVALAALAKALGFSRTICALENDQIHFADADSRVMGFDLEREKLTWRFAVVATQAKGMKQLYGLHLPQIQTMSLS